MSEHVWLKSCVGMVSVLVCGCSSGTEVTEPPQMEAFALKFVASDGVQAMGCEDVLTVDLEGRPATFGMSDLRFYISDIKFLNSQGDVLDIELDQNPFQFANEAGQVSLIDLTDTAKGSCDGAAIAFSEGTSRTNDVIRGRTVLDDVAHVSFDVGISQAMMQHVIANNTAEGAPSPMREMYWSWASGYRHFVLNGVINDGTQDGEAYLHLGSRACGEMGELALENQSECRFINTPRVELDMTDLNEQVVALDLSVIIADLDFKSPQYDPMTFEVIGEQTGIECHSGPMQPDCEMVFQSFGLDLTSGKADASKNRVFSVKSESDIAR